MYGSRRDSRHDCHVTRIIPSVHVDNHSRARPPARRSQGSSTDVCECVSHPSDVPLRTSILSGHPLPQGQNVFTIDSYDDPPSSCRVRVLVNPSHFRSEVHRPRVLTPPQVPSLRAGPVKSPTKDKSILGSPMVPLPHHLMCEDPLSSPTGPFGVDPSLGSPL